MRLVKVVASVALVLAMTVSGARAAEVAVKGVHLCCGMCVKSVAKALGDVKGVSGAACDRKAKTVTFAAVDGKAAKAGIGALAKAGFHGAASHGDKKVKFPASGAKKGAKTESLTLNSVHLCCGGCVKIVGTALAKAAGDAKVACDTKAKTVTVTGKGIDVNAIVAALNKAGFHGSLKK